MLKNYLLIFLISMVPIIELRGAIPIGLGMGLPVLPTYLLCVLGNMIPVPFIYLGSPASFSSGAITSPLSAPSAAFASTRAKRAAAHWRPRPARA